MKKERAFRIVASITVVLVLLLAGCGGQQPTLTCPFDFVMGLDY